MFIGLWGLNLPVHIVEVSFDDDQVVCNNHSQDVRWIPAEVTQNIL